MLQNIVSYYYRSKKNRAGKTSLGVFHVVLRMFSKSNVALLMDLSTVGLKRLKDEGNQFYSKLSLHNKVVAFIPLSDPLPLLNHFTAVVVVKG